MLAVNARLSVIPHHEMYKLKHRNNMAHFVFGNANDSYIDYTSVRLEY